MSKFTSRSRMFVGSLSIILFMLVASTSIMPAQTSAASRYKCGSQCNGRVAKSFVPSNQPGNEKLTCLADARVVATGYPSYENGRVHFVDGALKVQLMYSPYCQTMWLKMTSLKAESFRTGCNAVLDRFITPMWHGPLYDCPANTKGATTSTRMVDDSAPGADGAASATVSEQVHFDKYYVETVFFQH